MDPAAQAIPHGARFDLPYGDEARQRLDLYYPGRAGAPIIVYLYGGSWKSGTKRIYRFLGRSLARAGFLVAIPDYRLYPQVRFPAFVEDSAEAIAFVHANARALGGDPERIVIMGHSAGAHIGALLALDGNYLAAQGVPGTSLKGFIGLAGPYSFNPLEFESVRDVFAHHPQPDETRPIKRVRGDASAMLLLHGTADKTVGVHNSQHLAGAIQAAGGRARLVCYPGIGHIEIMAALAWPWRWRAPVYRDCIDALTEFAASP